jgi:hypothetical protein
MGYCKNGLSRLGEDLRDILRDRFRGREERKKKEMEDFLKLGLSVNCLANSVWSNQITCIAFMMARTNSHGSFQEMRPNYFVDFSAFINLNPILRLV